MENTLKKVYNSPRLKTVLKAVSHTAVVLSFAAYCYLLYITFSASHLDVLLLLAFSGVPFLMVTALRVMINAPRPYEVYDFYEKLPKNKIGHSFPSRHTFSVFLISTMLVEVSIPLAIVLLVFAFGLAISRVLLGMHFIRDVVTGAVIGVLAGLAALFIG